MSDHAFTLAGAALVARPSGALWWPEPRLLVVSDLHLGKSERMARRGGSLLPPYETRETLDRLATEIRALHPRTVLCLGDSFDDLAALVALAEEDRDHLTALMAGREWIWVEGNHDPGPLDLSGAHRAEVRQGPLIFRHAALGGAAGEVSGHYHPKLRLTVRGRTLSRPAFLVSEARVILPAFGAYTGGLRADHPSLVALMGPAALAILTGRKAVPVPISHDTAEPAV